MAKSCKGLAMELVKCLSESDCVKDPDLLLLFPLKFWMAAAGDLEKPGCCCLFLRLFAAAADSLMDLLSHKIINN
ncbi:Hypothetical predicted protein [Olea europaea subsp. europaea]|uniref:Uncharacterized protein n=1 Tax=Olea europaea subsp. europaea TaxID=158383 RepID=A0A8S0R760_OLEEU|nr:Hypothetical predicted protein [Olea europaea subsp. europaea]